MVFGYNKPKSLQDLLVRTDISILKRNQANEYQNAIDLDADSASVQISLDK